MDVAPIAVIAAAMHPGHTRIDLQNRVLRAVFTQVSLLRNTVLRPLVREDCDIGYRFEQPDFSVCVDGGFVSPRLWLIHAAIGYRKNLGIEARERLSPEVDLEVMRGLAREARLAWSGARTVRVLMDGDGDLDRFFEVLEGDPAIAVAT